MPTIVNQSAFLLFLCVAAAMANATSEPLTYEEQTLHVGGTRQVARVPKGYRLTLLADKLDGPRLLTFADNKDLFIGSKSGMIYRVPPPYNLPEVLVRLDGYPTVWRSGVGKFSSRVPMVCIARPTSPIRKALHRNRSRCSRACPAAAVIAAARSVSAPTAGYTGASGSKAIAAISISAVGAD